MGLHDYVLITFFSIVIWLATGCAVLSAMDDRHRRLFAWATSVGMLHYYIVLLSWPIIVLFWYKPETLESLIKFIDRTIFFKEKK